MKNSNVTRKSEDLAYWRTPRLNAFYGSHHTNFLILPVSLKEGRVFLPVET